MNTRRRRLLLIHTCLRASALLPATLMPRRYAICALLRACAYARVARWRWRRGAQRRRRECGVRAANDPEARRLLRAWRTSVIVVERERVDARE